jgi:hypothetical protein
MTAAGSLFENGVLDPCQLRLSSTVTSCAVDDALMALASNADTSRRTTAPAGLSPEIAWSADPSLGTCQITSFDVQAAAYTPGAFLTASGSTGDQPSDQPLAAAGDEKLVVLTCTNAAGAIAQKGIGVLAQ